MNKRMAIILSSMVIILAAGSFVALSMLKSESKRDAATQQIIEEVPEAKLVVKDEGQPPNPTVEDLDKPAQTACGLADEAKIGELLGSSTTRTQDAVNSELTDEYPAVTTCAYRNKDNDIVDIRLAEYSDEAGAKKHKQEGAGAYSRKGKFIVYAEVFRQQRSDTAAAEQIVDSIIKKLKI